MNKSYLKLSLLAMFLVISLSVSVKTAKANGTSLNPGFPASAPSNPFNTTITWTYSGGTSPQWLHISDNNWGRWWSKWVSGGTSTSTASGFGPGVNVPGAFPGFTPGAQYWFQLETVPSSVHEYYKVGPVTAPLLATPTASITASRMFVNPGETVTLSWSSTKATSCSVTFGASAGFATGGLTASSDESSALSATQTFGITCSGAGGSASSNITVTVKPTPSVTSIAPANKVLLTTASNLSFTVQIANTNALKVYIWTAVGGQDDIICYDVPGVPESNTPAPYLVSISNLLIQPHCAGWPAAPAGLSGEGPVYIHVYASNTGKYLGTGTTVTKNETGYSRLRPGVVNVSIDPGVSWTLDAPAGWTPAVYSGSGSTPPGGITNVPAGTWTIHPANRQGYTFTVSPGSTQSFAP